ncbi:MAG: DHHW family protein [Bacteroidota bacterium]|nr:DHHW family protein [Bacteroidota bacterium]
MKRYCLLIVFLIALTSCNSSGKKAKESSTDTTVAVKPAKDSLVVESRILPDDGQVGVKKRAVFIFKNRGFEIFSGGASMGKSYANVLNIYSRLNLPGLKIYNMIIPNGFEFEITERYKDKAKPAKEAIDAVFAAEDPAIIKVNPVDEIRKHRTEYIYFNTDHHWTSLGAYYAYRSFCAAAGLMPVSLDTIPSKVKPGFLGFFHRLTRAAVLKNNPDSVRYYLFPDSLNFYIGSNSIGYWAKSHMYAEQVSGDNSYSVFLQGDLPICKMETQHKNGRKIALIKESYGNAFAPFLITRYEKVVVVDSRYYSGDFIGMLKAEGINELLFLNNIFAAHTPFHISNIKGLMVKGSSKAKP